MKVYIPIISSILFFYSFLSHVFYAISTMLYTNKSQELICKKHIQFSNIEHIFLLVSHICIAFVMLIRTGIHLTGTILISVIGSIAHLSLCISKIIHMYQEKSYDIINILFVLGQFGMIYVYCIEHITENIRKMTWKQRHIIPYTFTVLSIYYIYSFYKEKEHNKEKENTYLSTSNLLVAGVYIGLLVLFGLHYKYYTYISIF